MEIFGGEREESLGPSASLLGGVWGGGAVPVHGFTHQLRKRCSRQSAGPEPWAFPTGSPPGTASSGRDAGAGEEARIPWRLEGDGGGRGRPLGAAQVPVVQLPQQLLVLHGEALVDFGLLLQGLLQHRLLGGELP